VLRALRAALASAARIARVKFITRVAEWGSSPSRDPVLFLFFDLCLDPDSAGWISTRAHVNPR
jgi:hypothetical protein